MSYYQSNPVHGDVECAFYKLSDNGAERELRGVSSVLVANIVESHIQAILRYEPGSKGGGAGRILVNHNNKGYAHGLLILHDTTTFKETQVIDINAGKDYNHPSGMQLAGDYLFMGVQDSSCDNFKVVVYDMSNLGKEPQIILGPITGGGGARLGVVTRPYGDNQFRYYLLVQSEGGLLNLYRSNPVNKDSTDPLASIEFSEFGQFQQGKNAGGQGAGLLVDQDDNLYAILASSHTSGVSYKDSLRLYALNLPTETQLDEPGWLEDQEHVNGIYQIPASEPVYRHMTTHGGPAGVDGVHFRWGTGFMAREDGSIDAWATARNYVSGSVTVNVFHND